MLKFIFEYIISSHLCSYWQREKITLVKENYELRSSKGIKLRFGASFPIREMLGRAFVTIMNTGIILEYEWKKNFPLEVEESGEEIITEDRNPSLCVAKINACTHV